MSDFEKEVVRKELELSLRLKDVTVTRGGKTFTSKRWEQEESPIAEPEKPAGWFGHYKPPVLKPVKPVQQVETPKAEAPKPAKKEDNDLRSALSGLGFSSYEVRHALDRFPVEEQDKPLEERVRLALKDLGAGHGS